MSGAPRDQQKKKEQEEAKHKQLSQQRRKQNNVTDKNDGTVSELDKALAKLADEEALRLSGQSELDIQLKRIAESRQREFATLTDFPVYAVNSSPHDRRPATRRETLLPPNNNDMSFNVRVSRHDLEEQIIQRVTSTYIDAANNISQPGISRRQSNEILRRASTYVAEQIQTVLHEQGIDIQVDDVIQNRLGDIVKNIFIASLAFASAGAIGTLFATAGTTVAVGGILTAVAAAAGGGAKGQAAAALVRLFKMLGLDKVAIHRILQLAKSNRHVADIGNAPLLPESVRLRLQQAGVDESIYNATIGIVTQQLANETSSFVYSGHLVGYITGKAMNSVKEVILGSLKLGIEIGDRLVDYARPEYQDDLVEELTTGDMSINQIIERETRRIATDAIGAVQSSVSLSAVVQADVRHDRGDNDDEEEGKRSVAEKEEEEEHEIDGEGTINDEYYYYPQHEQPSVQEREHSGIIITAAPADQRSKQAVEVPAAVVVGSKTDMTNSILLDGASTIAANLALSIAMGQVTDLSDASIMAQKIAFNLIVSGTGLASFLGQHAAHLTVAAMRKIINLEKPLFSADETVQAHALHQFWALVMGKVIYTKERIDDMSIADIKTALTNNGVKLSTLEVPRNATVGIWRQVMQQHQQHVLATTQSELMISLSSHLFTGVSSAVIAEAGRQGFAYALEPADTTDTKLHQESLMKRRQARDALLALRDDKRARDALMRTSQQRLADQIVKYGTRYNIDVSVLSGITNLNALQKVIDQKNAQTQATTTAHTHQRKQEYGMLTADQMIPEKHKEQLRSYLFTTLYDQAKRAAALELTTQAGGVVNAIKDVTGATGYAGLAMAGAGAILNNLQVGINRANIGIDAVNTAKSVYNFAVLAEQILGTKSGIGELPLAPAQDIPNIPNPTELIADMLLKPKEQLNAYDVLLDSMITNVINDGSRSDLVYVIASKIAGADAAKADFDHVLSLLDKLKW